MAQVKPLVNYSGDFSVIQSGDTLDPTAGGTGLSSFTAGNFLRAATATSLEQRTPAQVLGDIGAASSGISVTAGNGLTGGGTLSATRTLTLGTPSTLSGSTTNTVTTTSHTHALSANLSGWDAYSVANALVAKTDIPDAANLDTYTTTGLYHQNLNSQALSGTNYPVGVAGMLMVYTSSSMTYQTYQEYANGQQYTRSRYQSTWSPWNKTWSNQNLAQPLTQNTNQSVTANKTFTVEQTVDNCAINFRNWAGVATNGLLKLGDTSYIWKNGSQFELYNATGSFTAVLNAGGTIWTTANLAQPMTLNTTQTVTGLKEFTNNGGIKIRSAGLANGLDIGASPALAGGTDPDVYLYNRNNGAIWFGTNNILRGRMRATGELRWENQIQVTVADSFRSVFGSYGVIHRNDGSDYYILLTASGDQYGSWNSLRPFRISLNTGQMFFGNGVSITGNLGITGRTDAGGQLAATSRIFVKDGTDTSNPGGKVLNMYYLSGVYDGGVLQAYDYATAAYKPIRFEASEWNWMENGATTRMTLTSTSPARALQVVGGISAQGTAAQLETQDRTTARMWVWYGTGDVFYLYNGSGNIVSVTPAGQLSPQTFTASGANGAHFSGNGSGFQMNGLMYENGTTYNLSANGAVWVRNPRVFVSASDPGAQSSAGDVWCKPT